MVFGDPLFIHKMSNLYQIRCRHPFYRVNNIKFKTNLTIQEVCNDRYKIKLNKKNNQIPYEQQCNPFFILFIKPSDEKTKTLYQPFKPFNNPLVSLFDKKNQWFDTIT